MATGSRKTSSGKKRQTKKERMEEMKKVQAFRTEVVLWIIVAISLLLFISNLGFGGMVGKGVSDVLFGLFGLLAYVLPVFLLIGSFFAVSNHGNPFAMVKLVAAILFILFFCTFLALALTGGARQMRPLEAYTYCADRHTGGGLFGGFLAYYLTKAFGLLGSYIIDIIVLIVCLVLITERSALRGMQKSGHKMYESAKESNAKYREYREYRENEKKDRRMDHKVTGVGDTRIETKENQKKKSDEMGELSSPELKIPDTPPKISGVFTPYSFPPDPKDASPVTERKSAASKSVDAVKTAKNMTVSGSITPVENEPETTEESVAAGKSEKRKTKQPEQERKKEVEEVAAQIAKPAAPAKSEYVFPTTDLLKKSDGKKAGNTEHQLMETANKLEQTLKNFGVNVKVTNISCGPSVTRYEIQPEMGVKVSKIVGLTDDIKLNLAAADIRIEAPIPGKAAVGIEVPNKETVMVSFRELIESREFQTAKSKISFAVGKDISGKTMVTDIAKMPHLLIAGATGSGKSVCINTIIMSILYKAAPDEVKLIMIDPKVVELSVYNGIPHLLIPVVTDPKKASGALNWAVAEMTDRYEKFAEANVREINGYNAKVDSIEVPDGQERPEKMPQIVIIVDELADLMMVASSDVEEAICRLAQLARAAGIHLVIATQRPSVNVITGLIKANMPSRIAFAVTSGTDSRTILDMNGAEKLLGKGDMLFHPQSSPKPVRVQGAFVSDKEVGDVVAYIKEQNGTGSYNEEIVQKVDNLQTSGNTVTITEDTGEDDGRDAYFDEAAKIIIDKEKASIGMLQRYLKIGFNRAARIMDQLEEAGIVGPEEGTKPRRVLMTSEEYQNSGETDESTSTEM